ncbi:MAG TPA: DUF4910 domain-containing protein [Thermoanaerobaculia bacterium]|nr:DUF4910 domain-containing protein [Thermoanaerobaculia bacterium]
MHALVRRAYPLCRSITGPAVRQTLEMLAERIPLTVHEVPTGTPVLDWTVPKEWQAREAWIKGPDGRKVVDFAEHTLHLVSYSVPVHARMSRQELEAHLHSLPEQPRLIPYRTSYYRETWGFCLPHARRETLPEGEYEVFIDAELREGSLTWGELFLPGEGEREVLFSTHLCHPSLANDNLSGISVMTELAAALAQLSGRRFGYRFLFIPGTIGSITWLAGNEERVDRIAAGLVAANLGDGGPFHYKQSRQGDAFIDRAVARVLAESGRPFEVMRFVPFGYDERQFCSPGFNLPVGSLTRTPWGRYPEYHTSADDPGFVRPEHLAGSLATYLAVVEVLEGDRRYRNLLPKGEPQLGRRGLYGSLGGGSAKERELALLWVLNQSDGAQSLLDVAERSGLPFRRLAAAARDLEAASLLAVLAEGES